ncbi:MFS transporter [Methyloligella sp. 2.7D]|uniref:MFS transporter n=1 Tax=unclassified Methyloligella TaxID=2625955 RepID=UPI001FEECA64|nr:MFS transporter [Methyloligella sp. GL2]
MKVNIALFAAGFTTFALIYCVQPILPVFSDDFGVTPAEASLSLSVTTQFLAVSMLAASSLSEVFGRKPVMIASLFASSALMMATAFAPDWNTLLILRALAGITFSGLPPAAMAYVGEEIDAKSSGLAMGLYIAGTGLGALGGRFIAGFAADFGHWRIGLFVIGVLALISSVVFWKALPASRHFRESAPRLNTILSSFARHLKEPVLVSLFVEGFLLMGVFVSMYNYSSYRLMEPPYNFSQTAVSLIFGISVIGILTSAFVSDFAAKLGRARVLWALVAMIFAGVLMTLAEGLWMILAGLTLLTFAFYGAHSVLASSVAVRAEHAKAQASSLYLFAYYTGSSLMGFLGGLAWSAYHWPGVVALSSISLTIALIIAIALAVIIGRFGRGPRGRKPPLLTPPVD